MVAALTSAYSRGSSHALDLTLFSSSLKDRLAVPADLDGVAAIDLRLPVAGLNLAWHRLEWPTAEVLTRKQFDVTHSMHPLLLPSKTAARVITIHDLDFLDHPERTRAEIRRDYPALARDHAHRADRVIVVSRFTAGQVEAKLEVPSSRISICSPGAPDWAPRPTAPASGYILFLGTLEPRKNVGTLLDAYERLLLDPAFALKDAAPELVLAGSATAEADQWLARLARPPLVGRARHAGYVPPDSRRALYEGARLLVQPSFSEGFGIPVLEAMTLGVPVVAANRGALPEVLGDAGLLVAPEDPADMAAAMARILNDSQLAADCAARGIARARSFRWTDTAARVLDAYRLALERRSRRTSGTECVSA
jgi:glycosyltransferase involved in cell wall biosynthesis